MLEEKRDFDIDLVLSRMLVKKKDGSFSHGLLMYVCIVSVLLWRLSLIFIIL